MTRSLFIALAFAGAAPALAGDVLTDGKDAFGSGRYVDAYALLYPAARSGNAEAKYLVGQMLDQGLAGETAPDKALEMFIGAARLGHKEAKVLVEQTRHCVMENGCDGAKAIEIWNCGNQQLRIRSPSDVACGQNVGDQQRLQGIIDRGKAVDRHFAPLPGGHPAGQFKSPVECAAWAAAARPNEKRSCQ